MNCTIFLMLKICEKVLVWSQNKWWNPCFETFRLPQVVNQAYTDTIESLLHNENWNGGFWYGPGCFWEHFRATPFFAFNSIILPYDLSCRIILNFWPPYSVNTLTKEHVTVRPLKLENERLSHKKLHILYENLAYLPFLAFWFQACWENDYQNDT